jgi:hypothetical protein
MQQATYQCLFLKWDLQPIDFFRIKNYAKIFGPLKIK